MSRAELSAAPNESDGVCSSVLSTCWVCQGCPYAPRYASCQDFLPQWEGEPILPGAADQFLHLIVPGRRGGGAGAGYTRVTERDEMVIGRLLSRYLEHE